MKKTVALTTIAVFLVASTAASQVPGMPSLDGNAEANSLSVQALTATPADSALPRSRPVATAAATTTSAQQISPAQSTVSPSAIAAPTPRIPVPQAVTNIDAQLLELARLQQDTELDRARLELLNTRDQIEQTTRRASGNQIGLSEVPQLVGIMTDRGRLIAEFLSNGAILHVSEGEMVSPEWRLEKIRNTSVEIKRRGRNERHTLMFGGSYRAP